MSDDDKVTLSFDLQAVVDQAFRKLDPDRDPRPLTKTRLYEAISEAMLTESARAAKARKDALDKGKSPIKH